MGGKKMKEPKLIEVSCRKNWIDSMLFSEKLQFSVPEEEISSLGRTLILIHGYRGIFDEMRSRYMDVFEKIKNYNLNYDTIIFFYWPSSWSSTIGFIASKKRAFLTAEFLNKLVTTISDKAEEVVIQGHSLGCLVTMLSKTERYANWVFSAPAINHREFQNYLFTIFNSRDIPRLKIAYSKNDPVLKKWFRLVPENWFSPAIGYQRPFLMTPDFFRWFDFSNEVHSHSGYRHCEKYFLTVLQ